MRRLLYGVAILMISTESMSSRQNSYPWINYLEMKAFGLISIPQAVTVFTGTRLRRVFRYRYNNIVDNGGRYLYQ